jgi:hypothetical protein
MIHTSEDEQVNHSTILVQQHRTICLHIVATPIFRLVYANYEVIGQNYCNYFTDAVKENGHTSSRQ